MKTTRQRLQNIVITMSVAINLVMLGGLGYIVSTTNHVERIYSALNTPVMIYVPKVMETSDVVTSTKSPATQ